MIHGRQSLSRRMKRSNERVVKYVGVRERGSINDRKMMVVVVVLVVVVVFPSSLRPRIGAVTCFSTSSRKIYGKML